MRSRIYDHTLHLSCSHYLPVPADGTQIPTGEVKSVAGTLFDFTSSSPTALRATVLGLDGDGTGRCGLDHCLVVDGFDNKKEQQAQQLRHVATLTDPVSGRRMVLSATQPGVQIYSANWLDNSDCAQDSTADSTSILAHKSFPHVMHNALCLETQHFPDAINQQHFPTVVLRPDGAEYEHKAVFAFDCVKTFFK